ncbi:MAG: ATP-binding protein [Candidatus Dormibacteraeota bacterium]|uniref:ATP-binding protein n=1 Tax=Candidatus Nephthysia bennettiae TaxID=3127016 RepID=A0A934NCG4_9BACT|nr:ATP-binding protein [Candidatus Dormibacteraeota bacterium]
MGRVESDRVCEARQGDCVPSVKTLADFDFGFQPSVDRKQIQELATLRFLAHGEKVILLGPPGVGKTHLAVALGMEAVAQGHNVYFITIPELLDELARDVQEVACSRQVASATWA